MFRLALTLLLSMATASAGSAADDLRAVKGRLEGIWLDGRVPEKGGCIANTYDGETQIEFEFEKSGGRISFFEPLDLFTAMQIASVERDGDGYVFTFRRQDGTLVRAMRVRELDSNRIETLQLTPRRDGSTPTSRMAYRCGDADRSVNADIPMEVLRLLTPEVTLSASYPLVVDGVADDDVCKGIGYEDRVRANIEQGAIQFEVLGPVHYWVMLEGVYKPRVIALDRIRKVRQVSPSVLKLDIQGTILRDGAPYELTIVEKGNRFEIPEIGKTFIRCNPAMRGANRWF